jgi:TniQ
VCWLALFVDVVDSGGAGDRPLFTGVGRGDVRRLSHVPVPVAGESFDSWVDRTAHVLQLSRSEALASLGLSPYLTTHALDLDPGGLRSVCSTSGLPEQVIRSMLVSRLLPLLRHTGTSLAPDRVLRPVGAMALRNWMPLAGSPVCPACIAAGRAWRLCWKLPFVTTCVEHDIYLVGWCPACACPLSWAGGLDSRVRCDGTSRRLYWGIRLSSREALADPVGSGAYAVREGGLGCGFPLSECEQLPVTDPVMRRVAGWVGDALGRRLGVEPEAARVDFELMLRMVDLALYLGTPAMLDGAEPAIVARFSEYCRVRDLLALGYGARSSSAYSQAFRSRPGPVLLSVALRIATAMLWASDRAEAAAWFAAASCYGNEDELRWARFGRKWSCPPQWRPYLEPLTNRFVPSRVTRMLRDRHSVRGAHPGPEWQPARAPRGAALLAAGDGGAELARRVPDVKAGAAVVW